MINEKLLPVDRFLDTLEVVSREAKHLKFSYGRLYGHAIDRSWVRNLEDDPLTAECLEAFVSRFGRMQDTIADKLLPYWLMALAESPGSQIETLNRAEKLGVLENVEHWLEARKLRNRLIHEYMKSEETFAEYLMLAKEYSAILVECYNRICEFAAGRMSIDQEDLPKRVLLQE